MNKRECIAVAKKLGYRYDPREQFTKTNILFQGTNESACLHMQAHNIRKSVKWTKFFEQRNIRIDDGSWFLEIGLCAIYHVCELESFMAAYPKWFQKKEKEE